MLEYVTLGILCVGLMLVFYTFLYIHDIPYEIAKKRNHPQVEAIHIGCLLSLFTLHALWPLLFIWAVTKSTPLKVAVTERSEDNAGLQLKVAQIEARLAELESNQQPSPDGETAIG